MTTFLSPAFFWVCAVLSTILYTNNLDKLWQLKHIQVTTNDWSNIFFVGGNIGTVTVTWIINQQRTTAMGGSDYIADGATLTFLPGVTQKRMWLILLGGISDMIV